MHELSKEPGSPLAPFVEQYRRDQEAGQVRPLGEYLALFPGDEFGVAAEFLALEREALAGGRREHERIGPYRILDELGRGGQGVVYLAEDPRLKRKVALKVLTGLALGSEEVRLRFQREAEVASRLQHPGICGILEAGLADGVPYIAMTWIAGETLAQQIARLRESAAAASGVELEFATSAGSPEGEAVGTPSMTRTVGGPGAPRADAPSPHAPPPRSLGRAAVRRAVEIVEKAARATHFAHEAGIVHRDLKPGNIMITADDQPVILDFGLARDEDSSLPTLTRSGDQFGTPAYMSPEQVMGDPRRIDRRTDVFSLGITLYEAIALRRPFEAPTREGLYRAIVAEEPPDIRRLNPAVPRDLKVVVATALEKDRDRRYQTALDLAEDLRRVRENAPVHARPIGPVGRIVRWAERSPYRAASALLAVVLVAGGSWFAAKVPEIRANAEKARRQEAEELQARVEALIEDGFQAVLDQGGAEAIAAFDAARALDPASADVAAATAIAHLVNGRHEAALEALDRYPGGPGDAALQVVRAEALRQAGKADEAAALEAAIPPPKTAPEFFLRGWVELGRGVAGEDEAYRRAYRLLTHAIHYTTTAPRLFYYANQIRAAAHAGGAGPRDLADLADAITALWPDSSTAWYARGFALLAIPDAPAAEVALRESLKRRPDSPATLNSLGRALNLQGKLDEAVATFERLLAIAPGAAFGWANLGLALHDRKDFDRAIAAYEKAIAINPRHGAAWNNLGLAHHDQGRFEDAAGAYEKAAALRPRDAGVLSNLASALSDLGRDEAAAAAWRRVLEIDPRSWLAWNNLATILSRLQRYDEAIAACREAIAIRPGDPYPWTNMAQAEIGAGRFEDGIASARKALEIDPRFATAWRNIARAYDSMGRPDDLLKALEGLLAVDPAEPSTHRSLVIALTRRGDLEALAREHARWTKVRPESAAAWHDLAQALLGLARRERGKDDGSGALGAAEKAVALSGEKDPTMLRTLALILELVGRLDDARATAAKGLALLEGAPDAAGPLAAELRALLERFPNAR